MEELSDAGSIPARSIAKTNPSAILSIADGFVSFPGHLKLLFLFCTVGNIQVNK